MRRAGNSDLMAALADEGKSRECANERAAGLPANDTNELLRMEIEKLKEELENQRQDREQRKVYSDKIFTFMCFYVAACIVIVTFAGLGWLALTDTVLVTLLTSALANVIGVFTFVAKYLFHHGCKSPAS